MYTLCLYFLWEHFKRISFAIIGYFYMDYLGVSNFIIMASGYLYIHIMFLCHIYLILTLRVMRYFKHEIRAVTDSSILLIIQLNV